MVAVVKADQEISSSGGQLEAVIYLTSRPDLFFRVLP
jgi:hypothetical protein